MTNEKRCYLCGGAESLERHHVIPGFCLALWQELEGHGGTVLLCHECHRKIHQLLRPLEAWIKFLVEERNFNRRVP